MEFESHIVPGEGSGIVIETSGNEQSFSDIAKARDYIKSLRFRG